LSGDTTKPVISRGVPISRVIEDGALIAWAMNGKDLPWVHGYPLRLVIGGAPGSACGKWLTRIAIRNQMHDGPKMGGHAYRSPCGPLAPGEPSDNYCVLDSIRWMQRNQGLGALGSTEEPIVSYLAKHYPVPKTAPWRRPPLPAHLMPK